MLMQSHMKLNYTYQILKSNAHNFKKNTKTTNLIIALINYSIGIFRAQIGKNQSSLKTLILPHFEYVVNCITYLL